MTRDEQTGWLGALTTQWTVLRRAHDGQSAESAAARAQLWQRYGGAVRRYLLALVGDDYAAEDLTQEFALCLLRGEFRQADPQFGRFRAYVKAVLCHLVYRYRNRQKKLPHPLSPDHAVLASLVDVPHEADHEFNHTWRDDLLRRALEVLAQTRAEFHTVLQFRAAHPKMPSHKMAEQLGPLLGKPLSAAAVRQILRRARALYCRLLREEVAQSLDSPTAENIDEELGDLNLLVYCQTEA